MENRKAAGRSVRKHEKPEAVNNKLRKDAVKPAVRPDKSGTKNLKQVIISYERMQ